MFHVPKTPGQAPEGKTSMQAHTKPARGTVERGRRGKQEQARSAFHHAPSRCTPIPHGRTSKLQGDKIKKSTNSHKDRKRSKWQRFVISKVLFVELCSLVDLLLLPAMTEIHAHIQTARPPQSLVTTWPSKYRLMKYLKRPSSFRKY